MMMHYGLCMHKTKTIGHIAYFGEAKIHLIMFCVLKVRTVSGMHIKTECLDYCESLLIPKFLPCIKKITNNEVVKDPGFVNKLIISWKSFSSTHSALIAKV